MHNEASVAGRTTMSIGINLESAQVPDRRYVADTANAIYSDDRIKFLFGQTKLDGGLRSLLIINFAADRLETFLASVDAMQQPSLREIIDHLQLQKVTLEEISREPEQTTSLVANLIGAGVSGREACLDFYHISPFSIVKISSTHKVALDPVVRIHIRTALFEALIDRLKQIKQQVPTGEQT
ncbi:MAG: hypothetical protein HYY77_15730 [Betaproteobacteria bacterium]|nr:hypothetical protein [Betaproteobacteria bacterium]